MYTLQLCFSADGNFLYTGARKDPSILCWDVRYGSGLQASTGDAAWGATLASML